MVAEIVLTSASTHLRIILENENSSFTNSPDGSILNVEVLNDNFISNIDLCLVNEQGEEIWLASLECSGSVNHERIRVDCIFPLVFSQDETFVVCPPMILSYDIKDSRARFELRMKLTLSSEASSTASPPRIASIFSEMLFVGDTTVPVSKEVSVADFIWFVDSFHRRNWELSSVELALLALSYADRFELLHLHSRVLPYLKANSLPEEAIKDTLLLCARFKQNADLISWVLNRCKSEQDALKLLKECALQMPAVSMQLALAALLVISSDAKKRSDTLLERVAATLVPDTTNKVAIILRGHDTSDTVTSEDVFSLTLDNDRDFRWDMLWEKIPVHFGVASIGDERKHRGHGTYYKVPTTTKILDVDAYIN